MNKKKALVLMSGGLDSMLAAKILMEQGIEVTALIFKSYFFGKKNGVEAAKQLSIPCQVVDFSKKHLKIVKKPPRGYGKTANPCVDCHLLMLKLAKKIMEKKGFDFVATGEVLGERPFSQNKNALMLIAKESGLNDLLLRPLSAQVLPKTLPEKKGWVNRKKLPAIQGRSRLKQISLAKKYKLTYPQPAGGCILTDKEFSKKLFDLFVKWPDCHGDDVALLFLGRHFWERKAKIVLGKNQEENETLEKMKKKGDVLVAPENFPGPSALLRDKKVEEKIIKKVKKLILSYSPRAPRRPQFVIK